MEILEILKEKNAVLFHFGLINLAFAFLLLVISLIKPIEFASTNAWHKPIKFALSTAILVLSVAWYSTYLEKGQDLTIATWIIVITLSFEVLYIAFQASRGLASHYNDSSPFYSLMFSLMAIAASIATLAIAYIGIKFFTNSSSELPTHYLWAIRFGFVLFVIFSFEGFVMGANMSHTVGADDGGIGLPFLNWSINHGDLRIAHFVGMHALQILPILSFYILKNVPLTFALAFVYTVIAFMIFFLSLQGRPLVNLM